VAQDNSNLTNKRNFFRNKSLSVGRNAFKDIFPCATFVRIILYH